MGGPGGQAQLAALAPQVGGGHLRQPVGLVVLQRGDEVGPHPAKARAVGPAQPLEADVYDGVDRHRAQIQGPRAQGLGRVGHQEHPLFAAHSTQARQIGGQAGEGVDPGGAKEPRRRRSHATAFRGLPDGLPQLVGVGQGSRRAQATHGHASPLQAQPGQHVRRKVAVDDQHLVARPPGDAVGQEVQPVGGAVAQHDLVRRGAYQAGQHLLEVRGHAVKALLSHLVGRHLPGNGLPRRLGCDPGQWPLVGAVHPDAPLEGAKVLLEVFHRLSLPGPWTPGPPFTRFYHPSPDRSSAVPRERHPLPPALTPPAKWRIITPGTAPPENRQAEIANHRR